MDCEKITDDLLQADKMDLLYGEADAAARARVEAHLAACPACREELRALAALRHSLAAWQLPASRPAFTPRGIVVPRWLAAAAALLLGVSLSLGTTGYLSLRRELADQQARAAQLEERQRRAALALEQALARPSPADDADALLSRFDARLDERLRQSEAHQMRTLDVRFADWKTRAEAQRRVDLARVAEGLSYLDGRHGQQLARTNELMGYVLDATAQKR
jgi:anti-sigma factor RsiW